MKEKHSEAEIKLQLTESIYRQIKADYAQDIDGVYQKNFFLDSHEHVLFNGVWILRIRIESDNGVDSQKAFITLKGPGETNNAVYIRPEFESPVSPDQAESLLRGFHLDSIHLLPCTELIKRFGNLYVEPYLRYDNLRISIPWKKWKIELDRTSIEKNIFYELEAETEPAYIEELEADLKNLFQKYNWEYIPSGMSKFKRALQCRES